MDPFTEKLLERTRARRENLQKKLAERPNALNRPTPKRPLADTNSVITEPAADKVPQLSTKPSPSKRKCSEENVQPAAGEENQEPMVTKPVVSLLPDPTTDKKPPMVPTSIQTSSSLERTATHPAVQSQSGQLTTVTQSEPEKMAFSTSLYPPLSRDLELVPASSTPHKNKEDLMEDPAPPTTGMRSRLQMLAEQRKCWDGSDTSDAVQDYTPLSVLKRQAEGPPTTVPSTSSATPVGRKGRLANLAATIGSWEDDLSHANIPKANAKEKPGTNVPKFAVTDSKMAAGTKPSATGRIMAASAASGSTASNSSQASVKSDQVATAIPQKDDIPVTSSAPKSVTSPQKSSTQGTVFPSSPQKVNLPSATPVPQSPLKNQGLSRGPNLTSSPQKANIPSTTSVPKSPLPNQGLSRGLDLTFSPQKPNLSSKPVPQSPLKNAGLSRDLNLISSPQKPELHAKPNFGSPSVVQEKSTAGTPGVKSFLERFGERCQERSKLGLPAGVQTKTPSVATSVTPNTRLMQERIRAAQSANTTTADLTQRQKMERESELAMIRNRFQKGNNVWTNKQEVEENNKTKDIKEQPDKPVEADGTFCEPLDKPPAPSTENTETLKGPRSGHELMVSPPASTSSPLKAIVIKPDETREEEEEEEERITEVEMNVDQSINSDVINELFDGILEQSEDQSDGEEEDALNISSMSLLTPLAETVAAVVKSPERMMTSTPASSFIVKSNTPESSARRSKFQRANVMRAPSSESVEASDEDHKLPYSIDAYRSTRVKETERPNVKQVIVRKEDVSHRVDEPRGSGAFNVKQKMKMLSNEMNLQQTVIHQASQALNCCTDEEHGKGSQVEAEAERLLLVATERREALRAELDRLKGDPTGQKKAALAPDVSGMSASKGSIIVQELRLPLKADFVCSTANKPEATKYSFFIMIRAGVENTVATPLASTHRGLSGDTLTFPTKFTISDVSSNFEIDIEVYGLVQKREICGDKKKKPSKSKAITPKRFLAITKSVQTPVVASPGGPNAVRTSNFVLVGSHKLTLSSVGGKKFPLEKMKYEGELLRAMFHTKVPFLCPLEGHIYLKMQCEVGSKVEERGFLTMFEDVSGFGAWHRRWCVLSGYCISYWTYPDDEKRKNPIGRINLANCTSKKVEPANREFCARPNTFELITVRPQREDDKETLVSQCQNTMCVTKNWLSADTKDERNLWMKKLNQILVDLRMWQPDSCLRPQ